MKTSNVRAILSFIIVGGFVIVSGIIAIYEYATDLKGIAGPDSMIKNLKEYSGIFTGLLGVIIGYYFGKDSGKENSKKIDEVK